MFEVADKNLNRLLSPACPIASIGMWSIREMWSSQDLTLMHENHLSVHFPHEGHRKINKSWIRGPLSRACALRNHHACMKRWLFVIYFTLRPTWACIIIEYMGKTTMQGRCIIVWCGDLLQCIVWLTFFIIQTNHYL